MGSLVVEPLLYIESLVQMKFLACWEGLHFVSCRECFEQLDTSPRTVNVYLTSRGLTKELEKCIHLPFSNQNSWIRKNESSLVDDRLGKQRALQLWLRPVLKVPQIFVDIIFLPRCEKHTSDENPSYWKTLGTWDPKWHWCISICHCIPEVPTCSSEWLTRRRGNSA